MEEIPPSQIHITALAVIFIFFARRAKKTTRKFACIPPSAGRSGEAQDAFRKDENLQLLRTLDKIRTYFRKNQDAEF